MGRRYAEVGDQNATAANSILGLTSAATIRPKIYEIIVGCADTPADQAYNYYMQRYTAAGTSTAVTPKPLDPGDPASLASAGSNHTVEPTYTAAEVMQSASVNQQATWRWVVPPEEGITLPATAANGVGLFFKVVSGGTALCQATFYHEE